MPVTRTAVERDLIDLQIDDDLKQEIIEYRRLKPLIDLCLNLNHDINNPLAGILGYAEFILTDEAELTTAQRSNLEQIVICAERIQAQIKKLGEIKSDSGGGFEQ